MRAILAGTDGNVQAGKVTQIETALTDSSVTVTNASGFAGGGAAETDAEYRETIRDLIRRIRGATKQAIESAAKTVAGVVTATAIEVEKAVIEFDIALDDILSGAEYFRIPFARLYIADSNGTASGALIQDVYDALEDVRALGVRVQVLPATAVGLNWTASITLDPGGPNYSELASDPQAIIDSMTEYINELAIGANFVRATADAAILAIWGPAGTGDITAFSTSVPSGDVDTEAEEKLIAGTVSIV